MRELFKLTIVLTIICSAAATALALAYNLTKEPIAHQQRLKKLNAIRAVHPDYAKETYRGPEYTWSGPHYREAHWTPWVVKSEDGI